MGGVYTRVQQVDSLRPGDHIAIWDYSRWPLSYQHHGIVFASGNTPDEVRVCHVWSPFEDTREAHADSHFRVSTLTDFLYKRSPKNLRLVEYHTSALREFLNRWGEVHLAKSDLPEVVLARCKFLLGLGYGEFNLFRQNCEHAAHWCMTGEQWCKQNLTWAKGKVPFESQMKKETVETMNREIEHIKQLSQAVIEEIVALDGKLVHLRVDNTRYIHVDSENGHLEVLPLPGSSSIPFVDSVESLEPTKFRLCCSSKVYNCVKVSFYHEESGKFMFSRSTFAFRRELSMAKERWWLRGTGFTWEYSTLGNLKSMNQHRRYVGVREDGQLVDVSTRGEACRVEFVPCQNQEMSIRAPDIHRLSRSRLLKGRTMSSRTDSRSSIRDMHMNGYRPPSSIMH